jgi:predicted nucleic acid-binding protein
MVLYRLLQTKTDLTIVPLSRSLLEQGLALYEQRVDKEWSLTDCISFIVMKQAGITEALTGDRHFEQAGFTALLK